MKARRIDNFKEWREKMRKLGKIKSVYPEFKKTGDLAELIGVVQGDGHIGVFPRSEVLLIFSNSNNPGFVKRYSGLVENIFKKRPALSKRRLENCIKISLYEKYISKRLGVPSGARKHKKMPVPLWISENKRYIVRYLRGLYEAEGSFCVHEPTGTYKFLFCNKNISLLRNVFVLMRRLGFHPHKSQYQIQISRKAEVYKAQDVLSFRKY